MTQNPLSILHFLEGNWRLERAIDDALCMEGRAEFLRLNCGALAYEEAGTWRQNGYSLAFFQRFTYRYQRGVLRVFKNDGALLHEIVVQKGPGGFGWQGGHTHLCGQDTYEFRFTTRKKTFETRYTVKGPKKDYRLSTVYRGIDR